MKNLNLREPCAELQAIARQELNENINRLNDDLQELRSWLSKQSHITARTDNQFLIAFLRGCKFSLERSKEKLDMFYTIRTAIPEFFMNRNPNNPELQQVLSLGLTLPLPILENNTAPRILLIRQGAYDPSKVSVKNILKVSYMITDTLLVEDDNTVISGQIIIVDLKGLSLSHLSEFSAVLIKKMTSSIQEAYPIRQKGIHFVNGSSIFEAMYKIFYNFMSKKLKQRIFVHDSMESLHKKISKKLLPNEYGGDAGTIQEIANQWNARLVGRTQFFHEDAKYKTDESKRSGKAKNNDILFGAKGSFRSLEFD